MRLRIFRCIYSSPQHPRWKCQADSTLIRYQIFAEAQSDLQYLAQPERLNDDRHDHQQLQPANHDWPAEFFSARLAALDRATQKRLPFHVSFYAGKGIILQQHFSIFNAYS
jgi:hypothetical protein